MPSHRVAPMPVTLNRQARFGVCVWCGVDDLPRRKNGTPSQALRWHPGCKSRFQFLTDPFWQRLEVWKRDRGMCCDCGTATTSAELTVHVDRCIDLNRLGLLRGYGLGAWELDHDVPLWSVDHLTDEKRLRFFELENMKTRCPSCHKIKTALEARSRGKEKRIKKKATQPRKPSTLRSRPFDKRLRKKISGKTELRR